MNGFDVFLQKNWLYAKYRLWWIDNAVAQCFGAFSGELVGKRVLEIGCGSGYGATVIKRRFNVAKLMASDLDPQLIARARARVRDAAVSFEIADACNLACPDDTYDAIFDFGVIHHIPNWRECLRELRRVVKPGGKLFLIDTPIESYSTFVGWITRICTSHPYDTMFSENEFVSCLGELGFKTLSRDVYDPNLYYFALVVEK
ncbi:MAG TPA: class I SAM-dependent methyltransferase [Thermoanaerobaculia bacterium]|nr:class I SAM-dependent methyltransferase [Thermoanaerobaculia bacterium]